MCDYSLHNVATRPAQIEDNLVTTRFDNTITRGFTAVGEPNVAVCLRPGTEIAFDENVECESSFGFGVFPSKKIGQRLARFRQINPGNAVTHHDALEFRMGRSCCSRDCVKDSGQPCCNCPPHPVLNLRKGGRPQRFAKLRCGPHRREHPHSSANPKGPGPLQRGSCCALRLFSAGACQSNLESG